MSNIWTIEEFQTNFDAFFKKRELNEVNLGVFLRSNYLVLPKFPEKQFCSQSESVGVFLDYNKIETLMVGIDKLYGKTWLFRNDFSESDKLIQRLAKMFTAENPEDFPSIPVTRYENKYLASDGNHRLYHAYLRGWNVKIVVESEIVI